MGTKVMLGTIGLFPTFKLFEHCILSCISPLLAATDNQFGFKPKHGTDVCILLLKQTVSYYVSKDVPVFSTFLDAFEAFDRISHNLLFVKLIKRNVPMCIVRLLLSWYRQQTMQVKWGTNYSSPFTVTNGLRQGESWAHTYLLFTWMNSQSSWDQPGWDALWEIWL